MYFLDLDEIGYEPVLKEIIRLVKTNNLKDLPLFLSFVHPTDLTYIITRINNWIEDGNANYTLSYGDRMRLMQVFYHCSKDTATERKNKKLFYSKDPSTFY